MPTVRTWPGPAGGRSAREQDGDLIAPTRPEAAWDVIIIGAGPAGMAAALYTGRARLRTLVLDRMGAGGGQLMNTELIEDYPGFKSITGADMARAFEEQVRSFGVEVSWGEVVGIEAHGNWRRVRTDDTEYVGRTVIVATGGLPRKLGVPGEQEFAGRGVSYCAICDGAFFKGQKLAVVGGGDSAVEEAALLTRYAEKASIIHRRASGVPRSCCRSGRSRIPRSSRSGTRRSRRSAAPTGSSGCD